MWSVDSDVDSSGAPSCFFAYLRSKSCGTFPGIDKGCSTFARWLLSAPANVALVENAMTYFGVRAPKLFARLQGPLFSELLSESSVCSDDEIVLRVFSWFSRAGDFYASHMWIQPRPSDDEGMYVPLRTWLLKEAIEDLRFELARALALGCERYAIRLLPAARLQWLGCFWSVQRLRADFGKGLEFVCPYTLRSSVSVEHALAASSSPSASTLDQLLAAVQHRPTGDQNHRKYWSRRLGVDKEFGAQLEFVLNELRDLLPLLLTDEDADRLSDLLFPPDFVDCGNETATTTSIVLQAVLRKSFSRYITARRGKFITAEFAEFVQSSFSVCEDYDGGDVNVSENTK